MANNEKRQHAHELLCHLNKKKGIMKVIFAMILIRNIKHMFMQQKQNLSLGENQIKQLRKKIYLTSQQPASQPSNPPVSHAATRQTGNPVSHNWVKGNIACNPIRCRDTRPNASTKPSICSNMQMFLCHLSTQKYRMQPGAQI